MDSCKESSFTVAEDQHALKLKSMDVALGAQNSNPTDTAENVLQCQYPAARPHCIPFQTTILIYTTVTISNTNRTQDALALHQYE